MYIVEGGSTGVTSLASADVKINGRSSADALGGALCPGGDLDGDGNADLLAGAQNHSSSRGAVFVFSGPLSGTLNAAAATARIRGASSSDRAYVCGGGQDVNFDGYDDVVVGGEGHGAGGSFAGAAWLLRPEGL